MKRDWFDSLLVGGLVVATALTLFLTLSADYNIGTGFLARVSPVIAEGNMVAITSAGLLYDSGVSAYSAGTSGIHNTNRSAGWTDTLGGASLHMLELAFAQYADSKIPLAIPAAAGNLAKLNISGQIYDGGTLASAISTKQDLVVPAAAGRLAALNIAGQLYDSGAALSSYMTPAAMASAIMTFGKIKTVLVSYDTHITGITDSVCDNALGNPATLGAGYQATITASVGTAMYRAETDGINWFYTEKTRAP